MDKWHKSKIRKNKFTIKVKRTFVLSINLIYFYFVFVYKKQSILHQKEVKEVRLKSLLAFFTVTLFMI